MTYFKIILKHSTYTALQSETNTEKLDSKDEKRGFIPGMQLNVGASCESRSSG